MRIADCSNTYSVAVLLPCYNEEVTIKAVVSDFRKTLPDAKIYVFDNNSSDNTAEVAKQAGAIVVRETRQGKGNVIRSMFERVDADIYIMADGDDTYPVEMANRLIVPVLAGEADMTVGDRLSNRSYQNAARRGKLGSYGNFCFTKMVNILFHCTLKDIFSGYRVFNRKFVKTVPILSDGFQVETEMTLFALDKRLKIKEIPITFKERPEGSDSKLNTFRDGFRILKMIVRICKDFRPLQFYSTIAAFLAILSLSMGIPVILDFFKTGLVLRFPTAFLCSSLMILAMLSLSIGLVLHTVIVHSRAAYEKEFKRYPWPLESELQVTHNNY
ncbi:MAG: glycosyl transferase family protein [Desulfobulbaceae bacterium BRH_c16a]|nr:MAG: glycosyl transferase family protein [Desulfobulbaceae bacterium BRH_c16a]